MRTNKFSFWAECCQQNGGGRIHPDIQPRISLHVFYRLSQFINYSHGTFISEIWNLITNHKYVPNMPAVLWTIVWHLTKPSSRQHLEFLGIPSNIDPWRNRFLLQFHSLHTLTTKGCNIRVESKLCDLDESCSVCCEFMEVCFKTCWHVDLLNETCVLLRALGEP